MLKLIMFLIVFVSSLSRSSANFLEQNPGNLNVEIQSQNFEDDYEWLHKYQYDLTYASKKFQNFHVVTSEAGLKFLSKRFKINQVSLKENFLMMAPDGDYQSPDDVNQWANELAKLYPEFVHLESIGKSLEGRDLWAIRISDDQDANPNEPSVIFNALHHAREVMTVEVIMDIATWILENHTNNDQAEKWLKSLQIYLIPMVNPDGSNKVWTGNSMWRKNVRDGHGVDINRNYPYKWNTCNGSSSSTYAQDYRGPSAASEPETQVMMAFIKKAKPSFSISFHSYGEMVIYPFGCRDNRTPPEMGVEKMGKEMAATIGYSPGTSWELLYDVDGGDIDWLFAEAGVIPFVIEVSPRTDGFQPSFAKRDPLVTKVRSAWQYLLGRFDRAGINVSSSKSGRLEILKKQNVRWKTVYSVSTNEQLKFYPLESGNYKIKFRALSSDTESKNVVETFQIKDNTTVKYHF
ncbi:MAG: M14 family metallopeptidase [Bacteriovoracaceae bacterium]|nr:M14 family metallopeptidase [Bacteriovoracaceae bacterium]